jgi:hypothetical protein
LDGTVAWTYLGFASGLIDGQGTIGHYLDHLWISILFGITFSSIMDIRKYSWYEMNQGVIASNSGVDAYLNFLTTTLIIPMPNAGGRLEYDIRFYLG